MKYRIISLHCLPYIPGVYSEGEPYNDVVPTWIDVPDSEFGTWIRDLSTKFDVMLLDGDRIYVDLKGKRFHQR